MSHEINIAKLSPLPVVDLDEIAAPVDGLLMKAPSECAKHFERDASCRDHYLMMRNVSGATTVQCPYGFATRAVMRGGNHIALTGMIPFPRLGGDEERKAAKRNPDNKVTEDQIADAINAIASAVRYFESLEQESIRRQSVALHEIIKLNGKVKQTAERMCQEANPSSPDTADARLVKIWKSAELMSAQFEVIELLANEELATLPLKAESSLYRIFDKCVRIYNPMDTAPRISLTAPQGFTGRIQACDKTLPIIPSALIENALKYSISDTPIRVNIYSDRGFVVAMVTNEAVSNPTLSMRAFEKGVRFASSQDGSGNGLHLVKIVAVQHGGDVAVTRKVIRPGVDLVSFSVTFPELLPPPPPHIRRIR